MDLATLTAHAAQVERTALSLFANIEAGFRTLHADVSKFRQALALVHKVQQQPPVDFASLHAVLSRAESILNGSATAGAVPSAPTDAARPRPDAAALDAELAAAAPAAPEPAPEPAPPLELDTEPDPVVTTDAARPRPDAAALDAELAAQAEQNPAQNPVSGSASGAEPASV